MYCVSSVCDSVFSVESEGCVCIVSARCDSVFSVMNLKVVYVLCQLGVIQCLV